MAFPFYLPNSPEISSDRTVYLVLYIQYCLLVTSHFSLANSFCIFLTLFGTVGFVARKLYLKFGTNKLSTVVKHERDTEINYRKVSQTHVCVYIIRRANIVSK